MKKAVCFLSFFVTCGVVMFAQQQNSERITYTDGERSRTVTAQFVGYVQYMFVLEGSGRNTTIAEYTSAKFTFTNTDEWTDYGLSQREPAPNGAQDLTIKHSMLSTGYQTWKNFGAIHNINGGNFLRIYSVPANKASPFWWGNDGKRFYAFTRWYLILE